MYLKRITLGLQIITLCGVTVSAHADVKEYIRDYTYQGTAYDTLATSRVNAVDGVKRELLEELGTYVGSVVKLHQDELGNSYMSHDVVNITAGIVAMKVLEEKWKQPDYFVKAGMKADPDDVLVKLKAMRADLELEKSLRESHEELQSSRHEVAKLKAQLDQMIQAQKAKPANQPAMDSLVAQYVNAVQDVEVGTAFQRAMANRGKGDFSVLFQEMSALAEKDYPQAQYRLGWLYERGLGVAQDYVKARDWYLKAMSKGEGDAIARTGLLYELGLGVEKDYAKAAEYYQRAMQGNHAAGFVHMGYLYETGKGVGRNRELAADHYRRGVEMGSHLAEARLGFLYQSGRGVPHDDVKAVELYQRAVEHGQPLAMTRLGHMYNLGHGGLPKDHAKAMALMRESVRYHVPAAYAYMGFMYENGWEVAQDYAEAKRLYEKAAALEAPFAEFRLGMLYKDGLGVQRNKQQAIYWLERAASKGADHADRVLSRLKRSD